METVLRDSGGAYQCMYVICSFSVATPKKTQVYPQQHLHFVTCRYVLHVDVAEQSAPCSSEKIQQLFYSSQRHHCCVCPSATIPPDRDTQAMASPRHLGSEGTCPGKIQQN